MYGMLYNTIHAISKTQTNKLENMAINDVLSLKAAQRDTIANFKRFGTSEPEIQATEFRWCYLHSPCACAPFSAHSSAIYHLYHLPFGKVWLGSVCRVQRLATKQNAYFVEGG